MINLITSNDNDKVKFLAGLKEKKNRDEAGLFIVEGEHLVTEAYNNGYLKELIILEGYEYSFNINTTYVNNKVMKHISSLDNPTTIIGVCNMIKPSLKLDDKILILDNIQDPGNLGTLIRSALAFNFKTVILSLDTVDIYNPKVIRSTQGLIFQMNIMRLDIENFIKNIKNQEYIIIGTSVTNGIKSNSLPKYNKCALILGNEGQGIKDNILELTNENIYIPMHNNCESLNVAVAGSIILYELSK